MASQKLPGPEWFTTPQGSDAPKGLAREASIRRPCRVNFYECESDDYVECRVRLLLDSQNPRLVISVGPQGDGSPGAQLVFTVESNTFTLGVEKPGDTLYQTIKDARKRMPRLFEGFPTTSLYLVKLHGAPIQTGQSWRLEGEARSNWEKLSQWANQHRNMLVWKKWLPSHKNFEQINSWFSVLQSKVAAVPGGRAAFWAYTATKPAQLPDGSEGRRPELTWLRMTGDNRESREEYCKWIPSDPFFCNELERQWRLVEGTRIERDAQYWSITRTFSLKRHHRFMMEHDEPSSCFVHVKVQRAVDGEHQFMIPCIKPSITAKLAFVDSDTKEVQDTDLQYSGIFVQRQTTCDFVIAMSEPPEISPQGRFIVVVADPDSEPNLQSIDRQIDALKEAGTTMVYGDMESQLGQGYSLHNTIMARGEELNPHSAGYFELSIHQLSSLDRPTQEMRLAYILQKFPLSESQRRAFDRSIYHICAGVHLIQGPPGTGKTRTASVIILALACLHVRVLLAAGSNKGVDNLAAAVLRELDNDPTLSDWCDGQLVRLRSPSYQISSLRAKSALHTVSKEHRDNLSKDEEDLLRVQMDSLVLAHAEGDPESELHSQLLKLLSFDETRGLTQKSSEQLSDCLDKLSIAELSRSRIVATTLTNAYQEILQHPDSFQPDVLVCDESSQCLEGDHMIAMTIPSIRAVIFLGDPDLRPPPLISEHGRNECALYLKRSLMERLYTAGYPCTVLSTDYRSNAQTPNHGNREGYHKKARTVEQPVNFGGVRAHDQNRRAPQPLPPKPPVTDPSRSRAESSIVRRRSGSPTGSSTDYRNRSDDLRDRAMTSTREKEERIAMLEMEQAQNDVDLAQKDVDLAQARRRLVDLQLRMARRELEQDRERERESSG
ncbi:hypothetical protein DTO207G8_7809 [Paecilomyces variotii]|nr:hypothetical protein DTO207G8_7809 [Paecilomyces variotii]